MKTVVTIFVVAVLINYPWELTQAPLYAGMESLRAMWWYCFVASLGDGLLVLGILVAGWIALGRPATSDLSPCSPYASIRMGISMRFVPCKLQGCSQDERYALRAWYKRTALRACPPGPANAAVMSNPSNPSPRYSPRRVALSSLFDCPDDCATEK
jgi:hypothetical protein